MKKQSTAFPVFLAILLISMFSCQQEDSVLPDRQGVLKFGGIDLAFAPIGSPGSRILGTSEWKHVFPNSAEVTFTNKSTGQTYVLKYNPNDFSVPYSITLPYGEYEYRSIIECEVFSHFLPFEAVGEFRLDSQTLELTLKATSEYGLITVKKTHVKKASVSSGSNSADLKLHEDCDYWFIYVKSGTKTTLRIEESYQGSTILRELDVEKRKHYNFVLKINEGSAIINDLIMEPFDLHDEEILIGARSTFFEENGTIKCPEAKVGEKGEVNGKVYEAVDRDLLNKRIAEMADLSCMCTSLVTDMSFLFKFSRIEFDLPSTDISTWDVSNVTTMEETFRGTVMNEDIGRWDVSKVTNMKRMFDSNLHFDSPLGDWNVSNVTDMSFMFNRAEEFNQPIGQWDVSNVINMERMFYEAFSFNQPIGDWNVGKVENMHGMFGYESMVFNQPIGNWNVSNVKDFSFMFFDNGSFNQPIGEWNVSNAIDMRSMFYQASRFNQSLEDWDVSGVINMESMFYNARDFNQPLEKWDVSNVTNMTSMFNTARAFNQNISSWCVSQFESEPVDFSQGSPLSPSNKPIWGTCPD